MWWFVLGVHALVLLPALREFAFNPALALVLVAAVTIGLISWEMKAARTRIAPSELEFSGVELNPDDIGGHDLVGRVRNRSTHDLSSFTLLITVEDCIDDTTCNTVESEKRFPVWSGVRAGQTEPFTIMAVGPLASKGKGRLRWRYQLTEILAGF